MGGRGGGGWSDVGRGRAEQAGQVKVKGGAGPGRVSRGGAGRGGAKRGNKGLVEVEPHRSVCF